MKMGRGEVVRVDMTAPYRALLFPFLELILITGLAWMAIGWADSYGLDVNLRNGIVGLWAVLSLWRFGLPLYRTRRRRFIVTNLRVIAREGSHVDSIPLRDIRGARRRRGGISSLSTATSARCTSLPSPRPSAWRRSSTSRSSSNS